MLFYTASLSAVYGGTDGGANEEATSQFTLRAKCAKRKPTFADKLIIHQSLRHVTITSLPSSVFHLWWCRALSGMGVYSETIPSGAAKKAQTAPMKASKRFMTSTERLMRQLQKLHSQVLLTF